MRVLVLAAMAAGAMMAGDVVKAFGYEWEVPSAADWKVETVDGVEVLRQVTNPIPKDVKPRRPLHYALAKTKAFSRVTIECEMKRVGKSMIILYAHRDAAHYNYVHFSVDAAKKVQVHNGVFHVYDGDRVRISKDDGPGSLPTEDWVKVKVVHDGRTGRVHAEVDGKKFPSLEAVDMSVTEGRVGLGSFFETGAFRRVKITGE